MHHVDRGPGPEGLMQVRESYTPRWVAFYRDGEGDKPPDTHWRRFCEALSRAFHGLCAYCEDYCKGEVDHFRPKTRFPELVYEWSNWVFSCHDCNHAKGDSWPEKGYINPCEAAEDQRAERFFDFDTQTGEILPHHALNSPETDRGWDTIRGLDLNGFHHLRKRLAWLTALRLALSELVPREPAHARLVRFAASTETNFSSIARALFSQLGYSWQVSR